MFSVWFSTHAWLYMTQCLCLCVCVCSIIIQPLFKVWFLSLRGANLCVHLCRHVCLSVWLCDTHQLYQQLPPSTLSTKTTRGPVNKPMKDAPGCFCSVTPGSLDMLDLCSGCVSVVYLPLHPLPGDGWLLVRPSASVCVLAFARYLRCARVWAWRTEQKCTRGHRKRLKKLPKSFTYFVRFSHRAFLPACLCLLLFLVCLFCFRGCYGSSEQQREHL